MTVVVAIDPSQAAAQALDWALEDASLHGDPVLAVAVYGYPSGVEYLGAAMPSEPPQSLEEEAQSEADSVLAAALARFGSDREVQASAQVIVGSTAQTLLETAKDARLLVVGTRGVGALSRLVLGSVSSAVLHHARLPVVVVPAEHRPATSAQRRVVVGVDHSPSSAAALSWAAEQAALRHAVLVPAMVRPAAGDAGPEMAQLEGSERAALLRAVRAAGAPSDLAIEPEVIVGQPAEGLLQLAADADLLVVGSRGRGGFGSLLLGSTSTQCAQHARCPVAVLRPAPAQP